MCKRPSAGPPCSGHTRAWASCSLAPGPEGLPWASPRGASEPGPLPSPLAALPAACPCIQPSAARLCVRPQALRETPTLAGRARLQTPPGTSYTRCRRTEDPEKPPVPPKATDDTSKENRVFLSVSSNVQRNGEDRGPAVTPVLRTPKGPSIPRTGECGADSCLLQAGLARSGLLALGEASETQKAQMLSAAMFRFLYTVSRVSSYCFR